ncbi:hypothetical protein KZ820_07180 [Sphingomonas sp. RRHST34]|uniref:Uncharacterized protein n=1 Tax=Sphingomonas citri TaxID=2862499 RepID=A0ABS7BLP8_9SPHN|nr:hypothetical protein [Sphingomonas citri]MBW6530515.1 hypothetical protein [Sphingomonas citri]
MPSQTRQTAIAIVATRKESLGEPRHIVVGSRLVGGDCQQFIGFFDADGLDQWFANGGQITPDDALNCVFQSFRKDGTADRFYVPWDFPQGRLSQAGLFETFGTQNRRTIRIPGIERIAYFVDGTGERLQPLGQRMDQPLGIAWKTAIPRLVLDLANPDDPAEALGSSILVLLPSPQAVRQRPDYIVVDHRLRHPLNAHAEGDAIGKPTCAAAALQTWHSNVSDPWMRHGNLRYPALAFWAAGVSELNQETLGHLDRSWKWTNAVPELDPVSGLSHYTSTSLYALSGVDAEVLGPLAEGLQVTQWRKARADGRGMPLLEKKGLRTNFDRAPIRGFGLRRRSTTTPADPNTPERITPVLFGNFPIETQLESPGRRALLLPSGFTISATNALDNRRRLRAELDLPPIGDGASAEWLVPARTIQWRVSVAIPADELDPLPSGVGTKRPLAALRDMLAERAEARAVARGMPPISFAPQFGAAPGLDGEFHLEGTLTDNEPWRRAIDLARLEVALQATIRVSAAPGTATWPAVLTHEGNAYAGGKFYPSLDPTPDEETQLGEDLGAADADEAGRFRAQRVLLRLAAEVDIVAGERLRIGALDLRMRQLRAGGSAPNAQTDAVRLTIVPAVARIGNQSGLRLRLIAAFPIFSARPGASDRPPADRDLPVQAVQLENAPDYPLLLPLDSEDVGGVTGVLRVTESFGWGLDPQLGMSLSLQKPLNALSPPERWLVVGRLPMQVVRLEMPVLARRADASDSQVAVWSSGAETSGSWRLRDPDETATLVFGPQGIGEAMEKGTSAEGYLDIEPDARADFRLTPPAVVEIDPSPLDSGFVEPAWNIDRIFGRPGVFEPGARMRRAAYELLYGMAGAVSDRSLKNAQLRLSDVSARYGVPPNRLTRSRAGSNPGLSEWIDDWNSLRRAALTRPLALSVTRTDQAERFELEGSGVDFRLRTSARLKYPIPNVPPPDHGPWTHPDDSQPPQQSAEGHLAGGAGWAFESRNIVESVYAQPRSNAGRVRDLTITPLGGYGNVRGLFDNRRTAIEATVALGRTHFFALERIGRIGALWNKAKHVIIYRREVVPAGQFYNEPPIGKQQDAHAGRVVLRKWEEYVEIVQPERRYPDLPDAAERAGFLLASRFHSQRIRVDSRWGADVPGAGWMVPLWRSVFRTLKVSTEDSPAAIYPIPHIALVCAGRDGQEHEQEVRYPENLVFFASTRPGETDDTDAWAVTEGIDWADELWPEVPLEHGSGSQPFDAKLAKPVVSPAEQGRFAIELIRGEPVAVAHTFDADPPLAAIDSVTIARAAPKSPPSSAAAPLALSGIDELRMVAGDARAIVQNLARQVREAPLSDPAFKARDELARRSAEAKRALGGIAEAAKQLGAAGEVGKARDTIAGLNPEILVQDGCAELKRLLQSAVDTRIASAKEETARFASQIDGVLQDIDSRINVAGSNFADQLAQAGSDIDGVFALAFQTLDRIQFAGLEAGAQTGAEIARVRDEVVRMFGIFEVWRDAQTHARQDLDTLLAHAGAMGRAEARVFARECRALAASADQIRGDAAKLAQGLDSAIKTAKARRSDVPNNPLSVLAAFDAAITSLSAFRDAINSALVQDALAGQPQPLLQWIRENALVWAQLADPSIKAVQDEIAARIADLDQSVTDLEADLEERLGDLAREAAQVLDAASAPVQTLVEAFAQQWPKAIAKVRRPLEAWRNRFYAGLDRCVRLESGGLEAAHDVVLAARGSVGEWKGKADAALTKGGTFLSAGADALADKVCDGLKDELANWKNQLVQFIDNPAFDRIGEAIDEIASGIQDVTADMETKVADLEQAVWDAIDKVAAVAEEKRAELGRLIGAADRAAAQVDSVLQKGDRALALMRAVGDPPKVEMLDFNRPGVAYVFNALDQHGVRLSPVVAEVNRAASTVAAAGQAAEALNELLSEFGLRIPFRELGNSLTPDALKNFEISRIVPQIGGLDLANLFVGEKFPSLGGKYADAVQISHGFKPEEGRAWLTCKVNAPLEEASGKPRRIFALGPVQLDILKGHFGADARFEARLDGGASKKIAGAITGDWQLTVFGTRLVTFVETGLRFDDSGKFDFDVQADRIRLADALQYLVQLLKSFGGETLTKVRPIESDGRIVGMTAPFSLSIGDIELGAFSISGIQLNCEFTVIVSPSFLIEVRADVNSKMSPFTMCVGTMIGGGYLTSNARVVPSRGEVSQRMSIAVMAGIGRTLNVAGIAKGHGYLQFGVEIELYFSTRGGGAGGALIAFIIASGNLVILGIVNCSITLRLETRYDTAGGASASGQLSVRIKISFFYTLEVDRAVNYRLSGGGGGSYSDSFA